MQAASVLVKPASSLCNMNCQYCFYQCMSSHRNNRGGGMMPDAVLEKLVKAAFEYADEYVCFAFQGGEPTLIGLDFFQRAIAFQKRYNTKKLKIDNMLQTNGLLINDEWGKFLKTNQFLVGISLDGPKKIHNFYRKDREGEGTFERIMNAVNILRMHGVPFNILSVITDASAGKAHHLYQFYKRNRFDYVQLIPCLNEQIRYEDHGCKNDTAVTPDRYGSFLCEMFDMWYQDFIHGEEMDIRMFSNLAQLAAGILAEECGMNGYCSCNFTVEWNGNVYPCDFYCTDEWKLGDVSDSFQALFSSSKMTDFIGGSYDLADKCRNCQWHTLCRGGCRRWREQRADGESGINYLCSAYKQFFQYAHARIEKLGEYVRCNMKSIKMS